ncbi:MAG: GNAT family N-acetyltransferase [Gemmatimonadaceae bacterium]|nr:GNAT family N-acetyltransferase [Gemmatimonadaceae bacterium]
MGDLRRLDALPRGCSASAWLEGLLPDPPEDLESRLDRCRKLLDDGRFDREASLFAGRREDPAALVVCTTAGSASRLEMLAVGEGDRRRGLGRALLTAAVSSLRARGQATVRAEPVSSREGPWRSLLESLGFEGRSLGSLRMHRRLNGRLPAHPVPPGYELRCLRPGEEEAWVELRNACFPGDPWPPERYGSELSDSPVYELDRILVATREGRLAGTTIAWEADYGGSPGGLIHWVGVHPRHRGAGLAKALNARALRQLADRGYAEAWLNTSRRFEPAVGLYHRLGFEIHREMLAYELILGGQAEAPAP